MSEAPEPVISGATGRTRWGLATAESRSAIKWVSTTLAAGLSSSGVLALHSLSTSNLHSLPSQAILEIVLLSLLGTFGLTLSIYALMRTLVPKPRSLADIDSKTEQRNRKIIAELLPPGVDTLDELADRMVSCAVGASELSVMAADAIDGDESRMLDRLALVQTRNYRIFAERRERILDRLEQAQLRRDIFSSSLLFLAGALIASGAMIPAGVKSRIEPSTAKIYILHPTTLERQERWSHLGVLSCVVGNEGELPVISTGDAAPSPGSIVDTIGFPEECQKRSLVVPSWVTITELIVERIE